MNYKKKECKKNANNLPSEWLAFVLLAAPGKKLSTCIVSKVTDDEIAFIPKDKLGRRGLRASQSQIPALDESNNQRSDKKVVIDLTETHAIGRELLQTKRKAIEMSQTHTKGKALERLFALYSEEDYIDIEKKKKFREQLIKHYEKVAFIDEEADENHNVTVDKENLVDLSSPSSATTKINTKMITSSTTNNTSIGFKEGIDCDTRDNITPEHETPINARSTSSSSASSSSSLLRMPDLLMTQPFNLTPIQNVGLSVTSNNTTSNNKIE